MIDWYPVRHSEAQADAQHDDRRNQRDGNRDAGDGFVNFGRKERIGSGQSRKKARRENSPPAAALNRSTISGAECRRVKKTDDDRSGNGGNKAHRKCPGGPDEIRSNRPDKSRRRRR